MPYSYNPQLDLQRNDDAFAQQKFNDYLKQQNAAQLQQITNQLAGTKYQNQMQGLQDDRREIMAPHIAARQLEHAAGVQDALAGQQHGRGLETMTHGAGLQDTLAGSAHGRDMEKTGFLTNFQGGQNAEERDLKRWLAEHGFASSLGLLNAGGQLDIQKMGVSAELQDYLAGKQHGRGMEATGYNATVQDYLHGRQHGRGLETIDREAVNKMGLMGYGNQLQMQNRPLMHADEMEKIRAQLLNQATIAEGKNSLDRYVADQNVRPQMAQVDLNRRKQDFTESPQARDFAIRMQSFQTLQQAIATGNMSPMAMQQATRQLEQLRKSLLADQQQQPSLGAALNPMVDRGPSYYNQQPTPLPAYRPYDQNPQPQQDQGAADLKPTATQGLSALMGDATPNSGGMSPTLQEWSKAGTPGEFLRILRAQKGDDFIRQNAKAIKEHISTLPGGANLLEPGLAGQAANWAALGNPFLPVGPAISVLRGGDPNYSMFTPQGQQKLNNTPPLENLYDYLGLKQPPDIEAIRLLRSSLIGPQR